MIARVRDVDVKNLLCYNLCTIPQSLANYDGSMCKTNKAVLMHHLEQMVKHPETYPDRTSATVIDGMAVLQQMKNIPATFGELSLQVLKKVIAYGHADRSSRIDFTTDNYPDTSIKGSERLKRSQKGVQITKITGPEQRTPRQFSKFLSAGKNKESLVNFLYHQWCQSAVDLLQDKAVFFAHGSSCHSISVSDHGQVVIQNISELECDHEEADTRMLLHASHASKNFEQIIIHSADTDVLVLAVGHQQSIESKLYINPGNRIISVSAISDHMGDVLARSVMGLHAFTGCDSTSAFRNKGKVKGMSMLSSHAATFEELGSSWECEEAVMCDLETFVCELYGQNQCHSVNEARYNWFRLGCKSDASLPPNRDSLCLHIKRANYQASVFRRSLCQKINAPTPTDHGWSKQDNELVVTWMNLPPAPDSILSYAHCRCQKNA